MYLRPRSKPESERRWAQRRAQKWQRAEATATTSSTTGGGERFFCWLHGIDAHHHTHQCPSTIKKKLEWEAEEKAKAAGLAVNHVMKCQNQGQCRALPPAYLHQSFQPSAPAQVFQPAQVYTPSAP
jgi:hypothetical protein